MLIAFSALGCTYADAKEDIKNEIKEDIIEGVKNKLAMSAIDKISTTCKKDGDIKWNFTKFLVDKNGNAVKRYDPTFDPKDIEKDLIELL